MNLYLIEMNIIKFRAWHTIQKKMYSPEEMGEDQLTLMPDGKGLINVSSISTQLSQFINEMIPLQFTGLKDKNGKEVYDGDIIQVDNEENPAITECKYDKGCFILEDNAGGHWTRQLHHQPERLTIIGNIYENPELLK